MQKSEYMSPGIPDNGFVKSIVKMFVPLKFNMPVVTTAKKPAHPISIAVETTIRKPLPIIIAVRYAAACVNTVRIVAIQVAIPNASNIAASAAPMITFSLQLKQPGCSPAYW